MSTRGDEHEMPRKCDFSSEKELSVTQGFTGELRSGGSQAEAWDAQQTWERNFRREEKGMKEVIKTAGLQAWASCRTTDRHTLQLEREPAGKDERSDLGHPEFQALAKQSKENVNQRQKSQVRTEAVSGPLPIRGQTSNSSSNYTPVKINLKRKNTTKKTPKPNSSSLTSNNDTNTQFLRKHGYCSL